jgi:putative phage-type endonuclease
VIVQGSPEWFAARCGKVTASRVADVVARTRSGWGASRANYAAQLIAERLTGTVEESFSNAAMRWGTETEPQARAAYEFFRDQSVLEVGFVDHPVILNTGASPDGLVGDAGLLEIKCPNTSTHIATLREGKVPDRYTKQIQWQLACTERFWCDFVSFDPRMPVSMQMFVTRIEADEKLQQELSTHIIEFISEIDAVVEELRAKYEMENAA